MERLLDIREVAEFLRVEYKTAYRLVTSGEIPAAKIGKSYRIKQSDLVAYFEDRMRATQETIAAKAGVEPSREEPRQCSWCGAQILSKLARTGECEVCAAVICENCSTVGGVRRCRDHAVGEEERPACGVCGTELAGRWAAAAVCAEEGCERPVCNDCFTRDGARRCLEHTPTPAKVAEEVARLREKGKPAVSAQEARVLEATFLSRVENRLRSAKRLLDPTLGDYAPADSLSIGVSREGRAGPATKAKGLEAIAPRNEALLAEVSLKRGRRKKDHVLTMVACSLAHAGAHEERGYDAAPVSLAEVAEALAVRARHAESVGVLEVVALASPTGWTKEAVAHVAGPEGKKQFSHRLVAACLVDTATGTVHANEHDDRLRPYLYFFTMESDEKLVERCVSAAEEQLLARNSFSLRDLLDLLPVEERIAELAFRKLGSLAKYILDQIEDIGLVLSHAPDKDT